MGDGMRFSAAVLIIVAFVALAFAAGRGQGGAPDSSPGQQGAGNSPQPVLYGQTDGSAGANSAGAGQARTGEQAGQETGTGETVQQEQQTRNEGDGQALQVMQQEQAGKGGKSQAMLLNQSIKEANNAYSGAAAGMPAQEAQAYQNQNRVRVAVHALLAAENLTGIGKNVSAVAREFNNSIQATVRSEEKVRERSGIGRFLFGGDEKAAGELEQQAIQNQQRIMQMQQLVLQCSDCEPGVQAMLQEQLGNMAQEQTRLMQLAQDEKKDKGIFGWLWK